MAGPVNIADLPFACGEAVTKFHAVKLVAGGLLNMCDTQGERALGIVQETVSADDAAAGRIVAVRPAHCGGVSRAIAGAEITTYMSEVTVGADGRIEPADSGDVVLGFNLNVTTTTGGDGDHIDVLLGGGYTKA